MWMSLRSLAGYSWTKVKVGLVTGMVTPIPSARPWTNVVLPEPRRPERRRMSPFVSFCPMADASAFDASAFFVRLTSGPDRADSDFNEVSIQAKSMHVLLHACGGRS